MGETPDDRPPMVRGMQWVARITTISLEMVLPGLAGLWIDRKLGTVMVFLVLGVALGMTVGIMHLVRLTPPQADQNEPPGPARGEQGPRQGRP